MAGLAPPLRGVRKVFADTSYFFALLDRSDVRHPRAAQLAQHLLQHHIAIVTTWEIVLEATTLLRYRLSYQGAETFLSTVVPSVGVLYPSEVDRTAAIRFFRQRSASQRLSLCDAMSYVMVTTRLDWAPSLTFDRDFAALGLIVLR